MKHELHERRFETDTHRKVAQLWDQSFARNPDGSMRSYVDAFSADDRGAEIVVHLRIFSNRPYSVAERAAFAEPASTVLQRNVDFQLVEIPTSHYAGDQHAR